MTKRHMPQKWKRGSALNRGRSEHEKLLTLSRPERHDHGASSLRAAINRPLTFFPLGETAKGSLANNHQKQGLTHENLQIVRCIHTHLLRAFTECKRGCSRAGWRLCRVHYSRRE